MHKKGSWDWGQLGCLWDPSSSSKGLGRPREITNSSNILLLQVQGLDSSTPAAPPEPRAAAGRHELLPQSQPCDSPGSVPAEASACWAPASTRTSCRCQHCQRQHSTAFSSSKSFTTLRNLRQHCPGRAFVPAGSKTRGWQRCWSTSCLGLRITGRELPGSQQQELQQHFSKHSQRCCKKLQTPQEHRYTTSYQPASTRAH